MSLNHLPPLLIKETTELLLNRQLVIFLTIAPVLSMVIFDYVLNSNIAHFRLRDSRSKPGGTQSRLGRCLHCQSSISGRSLHPRLA